MPEDVIDPKGTQSEGNRSETFRAAPAVWDSVQRMATQRDVPLQQLHHVIASILQSTDRIAVLGTDDLTGRSRISTRSASACDRWLNKDDVVGCVLLLRIRHHDADRPATVLGFFYNNTLHVISTYTHGIDYAYVLRQLITPYISGNDRI